MQTSHHHDRIAPIRVTADEKIRQFEVRNALLEFKLGRWSIWPVLRFTVYSQLDSLQGKKAIIANPLSVSNRLRIALHDAGVAAVLPRSDIITLVQSSNRSEEVDGKFKDIYFDDLLIQAGSFVKIENLVNRHFLPHSKAAVIPSQLTTTIFQLGVATMLRMSRPAATKQNVHRLSQLITKELGLSEFTQARISTQLANFYWSKQIYKLFFQRIRPRYLLLTTAYRYYAPVAAAKELGIQVIEFQHGLVDRYHNGYSWSENAVPYKGSMPIPDKLFLYGDYWKDELSMRGFWDSEVITVGSLRMDSFRQNARLREITDRTTLIVTTQNIDIQPLIDFFCRFFELARDRLDCRVIFKLHPGENDKSRYLSSFEGNPYVEVLLGNEKPSTYDLIANSDFHLSIYSTCHYESLALGVPTIILPFSNHQTVLHLCDSSSAYFVESPEELIALIERNPNPAISTEIGEYYFKSGALENMLEQLELGERTG